MKLPSPPSNLYEQSLPLVLAKGYFWRLWRDAFSSPFFWSKKGLYRFDSKSASHGVLYTGCTLEAAIVEVFGDRWVQDRRLSASLVYSYWATRLNCTGVKVVDTTGPELNRFGVDSMLFASTDYRLTRRWARAFMGHPDRPQGILYHSRKNPKLQNCAFFRSNSLLRFVEHPQDPTGLEVSLNYELLSCPGFGDVLDRYDIALV